MNTFAMILFTICGFAFFAVYVVIQACALLSRIENKLAESDRADADRIDNFYNIY